MTSALAGLTVVEIGGSETLYAGKLFADQGADVVLVEPSGGHPSRRRQPLVGTQDAEAQDDVASAAFTYLNGAKRCVELPENDAAARAALQQLIGSADVVLGGGSPARLIGLGVDPDRLSADRLVVTVTPFGWTGPWRDLAADELVLNAMGGMMSLGGYWDGRPLQPPAGLAYASAGLFAAVGAMTHLLDAEVRPGHVDVSVQESVVMGLENAAQFWDLEHTVRGRSGAKDTQVGRGVYACGDGYVYLMLGLSAGSAFWARFLNWLDDWQVEGREALAGECWSERGFIESDAAKRLFRDVVETMLRQHTRRELTEAARRYAVPVAPVNRLEDVFADEQLEARGYFVDVPRSDWRHGPGRAPTAPYRLSRTAASTRYAPQDRQPSTGGSR
ncbi:CoA transferase [Microbacterium pseudoresistens]|uniref:Benzylsuccinate CoA-transferase BbsE subunit n=1 Tax=Microbacterium pseudoresistens TaxID=640634 RepID=A0A7Y9JM83_9MICO|nr:benzylsuccinate CoA-transferase BbsE subunit [Microbacterium pseudoresistens]